MGSNWKIEFGKCAELWVCEKLRGMGLEAEHIGSSHECDVLIEGCVKAEVKCATRTRAKGNRSERWQFSFGRHAGVNDEDVIFLVCYDGNIEEPAGVFVIPGVAVRPKLKKIDITSSLSEYSGMWADFLAQWQIVKKIIEIRRGKDISLSRESIIPIIPF